MILPGSDLSFVFTVYFPQKWFTTFMKDSLPNPRKLKSDPKHFPRSFIALYFQFCTQTLAELF